MTLVPIGRPPRAWGFGGPLGPPRHPDDERPTPESTMTEARFHGRTVAEKPAGRWRRTRDCNSAAFGCPVTDSRRTLHPCGPPDGSRNLTSATRPAGPIVDRAAPNTRGETGQRAPRQRGGGGRWRDDSRILRLRSAGGPRRRPERPRGARG